MSLKIKILKLFKGSGLPKVAKKMAHSSMYLIFIINNI